MTTATIDQVQHTERRKRWWSLVVLVMPVLIISMDSTVLGFAVPQLSAAIEPSSSQLLWIIDIYSFVIAGLLVTMGVLGDRIGRRRLLRIGGTAFALASVAAAFSTGPTTLIVARAALGVAGATLMPSTLSLIRNVFTDARERQLAIAVWSTGFAVGGAVGPNVGGLLLDHFWWGSVFLAGVPVAAALALLAPRFVPESKDPHPGPFDVLSAALSIATMLPVVYAVKALAEHGPGPAAALSGAIGIGAGVLFVRRQHRLETPMIDLSLFRLAPFRMAVSGQLVSCFGYGGSLFFATQYLQLVSGMSAIRAGVQLLPAVAISVVSTLVAPHLSRRFGPFAVIAGGFAIGAFGFLLLTQLGAGGATLTVSLAMILLNVGLNGVMTVAVDGTLAAVPPERAGAGASVAETANELGIALGTALLGSAATAVYRRRIDDVAGVPAGALDEARETLGAAMNAADRLGGATGERLRDAASAAFVDGVHVAAAAATVVILVVCAWAWRIHRRGLPSAAAQVAAAQSAAAQSAAAQAAMAGAMSGEARSVDAVAVDAVAVDVASGVPGAPGGPAQV